MLPWLIRAIESPREPSRPVVEFGCGKGYLSFFLAGALGAVRPAPVRIVGVDRDHALVECCQRARDALGWDEPELVAGTCEAFVIDPAPLLVTSLHACDVVTDHVLAAGIALGAEHIVVAPCCQFTIQRRLRQGGHRHEWGYIARSFPLLGSRFSEFVTEAIRCLCLRAHGYDVAVREFVSGVATPKNVLIIARQTGVRNERAAIELRRLEEALHLTCEVKASLARRLAVMTAAETHTEKG